MMSFDNYDMIQDEIYRIFGLTVRFNVRLFRYNNTQQKNESYYNEFRRTSKETQDPIVMIRRNMDYFLSFSISLPNIRSSFVSIFPKHMMSLIMTLRGLETFLLDNSKWMESNGRLSLKGKVQELSIPLTETGSMWISFIPIVYQDMNNHYSRGVRMTMNSADSFVDMDINGFMGLHYTVSTLNMYLAAQNMLTYYGRPDPGTNRVDFREDTQQPGYNQSSQEEPTPKKPIKIMKFKDQLSKKVEDDFDGL